jgi:hypothetical protein
MSAKVKKEPKPTPWRFSQAKLLLYEDIVGGLITDDCQAELVYGMRQEFQEYPFANFKNNLKTLCNTINVNQAKADNDKEALLHDMAIRPPKDPNVKVWNGSSAQKLLKKDIDEGKHDEMTTRELWASRTEYQEWPAKKIIKHVHGLTNARKNSTYWENKKNKTAKLVKTINAIVKKPDDDEEESEVFFSI